MGIVEQELCDGCGTLISGKKGVVYQRNPAILITGQISMMIVDKETGWRDHIYITPAADTKLSVCNIACLDVYILAHLEIAKNRIAEKLRREAGAEQTDRSLKDMDYVVGRKPNYSGRSHG